uniref:Uncharacterized protein n=1 Tax=Panagrolaimus sp. PS1159 TaxID=55785 RepID=A0AC35ESH8_9BILA
MEDWKKAYKEIHGRTPTKKDVTFAPKALRGDSPTKFIRRSPRKSSTLKRPADSSFISPIKKRRILDSTTNFSTTKLSVSDKIGNNDTTLLSEEEKTKCAETTSEKPSTSSLSINDSINLLSPCKNWAPLIGRNASPKKTPQKKQFIFDSKSPSPMKPLGRSITCRNIKHLMDVRTPEKCIKDENEEDGAFEEFADEKPENAKPYKPPTERKKKVSDSNFVKINLRKRNYVKGKSSKFNKKKWLKYKKK